MAFVYQALKGHYFDPLASATVPELDAHNQIRILLLTLPYLYYTYLWHFPGSWCKISESLGMHPCQSMSYVAHGMKLVQFFVLAKYCGAAFPHYFKPVNAVLPEAYEVQTYDFELNVMAVVDVLLFAVGQALNSGVYSSLGTVGTFYGVRFGYSVPWVTGFPYNLGISDPQYWGAILTAIASMNLLNIDAFYVWVLVVSYIYMMFVERSERTPAYGKKTQKLAIVTDEVAVTPKASQKKKVRSKTPKSSSKKKAGSAKKSTKVSKKKGSKKSASQDLSSLKCVELRELLKKKGLSLAGRKAELIARLQS
eukprot:g4230.t1